MDEPAIRLVRPLQMEYIAMAGLMNIYGGNAIYSMSEAEFLRSMMRISSGSLSPKRVKELFHQLMDEAGLSPKFKCPIDYEGCTKFCGSYGCGG